MTHKESISNYGDVKRKEPHQVKENLNNGAMTAKPPSHKYSLPMLHSIVFAATKSFVLLGTSHNSSLQEAL
jgi:hypothetical protein